VSSFYRPPSSRLVRPRHRRAAWRSLLPALSVLALGLATLGGALVLKHHPRFSVKRVVLEGVPDARHAEADELTDPLLGRPLLFLDLDAAVDGLARRPWVARTSARRIVPDTLLIRVEARPPLALARRGGALWTIDKAGAWLGPYEGRALSSEDDFPIVDGLGDEESVRLGAAFLAVLKSEDPVLFSRVSDVTITPDGLAVTDRVARARLVVGTDPGEVPHTAAAWRAFLALGPDLSRRGLPADAADLRFDGRIVLHLPPDALGRGKL
jgi:hypothetical protein